MAAILSRLFARIDRQIEAKSKSLNRRFLLCWQYGYFVNIERLSEGIYNYDSFRRQEQVFTIFFKDTPIKLYWLPLTRTNNECSVGGFDISQCLFSFNMAFYIKTTTFRESDNFKGEIL